MSTKSKKSTAAGTFPPDSSPSDWLAALTAADPCETPGPEWKTIHDLEPILGLKRAAVQVRLNQGVKNGTVERKMFRARRSDGAVHSLPFYRIIK
jgi:hypothetical protein